MSISIIAPYDITLAAGLGFYPSAESPLLTRLSEEFTFSDNFDNSSLDSTNFGTSVSAADGSVVETTYLRTLALNSTGDAAIVYDKQIITPRLSAKWVRKHKFKVVASQTAIECLGLYQYTSPPAVDSNTNVTPRFIAKIEQRSDGRFELVYFNTAGTWLSWNGSSWSAGSPTCFDGGVGVVYVAKLSSDQTNLIFTLMSADEKVTYVTASIPWSSVRAESGNTYAYWGDIYTSHHYGEIRSYDYKRFITEYVTTSPAATYKFNIPGNNIADIVDCLNYLENSLGGTGSLSYGYQLNGGSLVSGQTLAQLKAAVRNATITVHTDSLIVYVSHVSNGTQQVESAFKMGGGLHVIDPVGGGVIIIDDGVMA